MRLYQMADSVRYGLMNTEELRETFLLEDLFQPDEIEFAYVDLDRTVIGSAVPTNSPLKLETEPELRADYFLERRELGALNIGGPGTVTVDGKTFELDKQDCIYVGRGSKDVTFASKDAAKPAEFYLLSYPAHAEYPTAMVKFADLKPVELGTVETCNKRKIYKAIYKEGIKQLPARHGFHHARAGKQLEHDASAYAHAAQRGVLLLRRGSGASRASPDGTAGRDEPSGDEGQGSCSFAGMVHPCRRWNQALYVLLGYGRRKPGV